MGPMGQLIGQLGERKHSARVCSAHDHLLVCAVGTCPVVEMKIGGVATHCLLDTGSQVSTVTTGFFREHFCDREGDMLSTTGWLKLMAENGFDIPY